MFIACLSPPEYKVQEGKCFVLFTTLSLVPKEPPHGHINKHGCVQNDIFQHVGYYISLYILSFWALMKWGPVTVEVSHFPHDFSTEQQALDSGQASRIYGHS